MFGRAKKRPAFHKEPSVWLGVIGSLAIVAGGMVSAFSAHNPTELAMWASAYLVLVVGVAQVLLGVSLYTLTTRLKSKTLLWAGFIGYNAANVCVLLGTVYKGGLLGSFLTNFGGLMLSLSLIGMIMTIRDSRQTPLLVVFYVVTLILFTSIPIGLLLARL